MLPPRSRLSVRALLPVLLATAFASSAAGDDLPVLRSTQAPFFTADVAVLVDTTARAQVSVTVTVPYSELNWRKLDGGFAGGVGFTVELDPDRHDRLYGDAWEKRLLLDSYAATASSRHDLVVTRAFPVPPGRYHVRVQVRDVNSDMQSDAEDRLVVEDMGRIPVGFADLQLGVLDSTGAFTVVPTRSFGYNASDIAARAVMFDRRPGAWPRRYRFHWRIADDQGGAMAQGDTLMALEHSAEPVLVKPGRPELFIGSYLFDVEMIEGKARWKTSRSFDVEESGPPKGKEFDQILEALSYIAEPQEVEGMRNRTPDQQAVLWDRFWKRRDPTPDTPRNEFQIEFFRRMRYADEHFSGFGPGWRSDMGRIYIRYGPPDQVEQRASTTQSPALELWYYNQPYRRFVFADREGFGRFTLISPTLE